MSFLSGTATFVVNNQWLRAAFVFAGFAAVALLTAVFMRVVVGRWVRKTETKVNDLFLGALRTLAVWGLLLAGGYYALRGLPDVRRDEVYGPLLGKAFGIAWALLAIVVSIRLIGAVASWNIGQTESAGEEETRDARTRIVFVRKLLTAVVLFLGGLYVLNISGVDTSPLVANDFLSSD